MKNPQLTTYSVVKSESTSSKIRNKTRMSTLTTFIQRSFGSPSHSNQRRRKGIQSGKEDVKLSLFEDDMIPCKENSNDAIRKLLELINESGKVAGHKIKKQKFLAFLYTNSERLEREIKETIPFTITSKRTKYI